LIKLERRDEMAFIDLLRQIRAEARGNQPEDPPRPRLDPSKGGVSFVESLRRLRVEVQANHTADPWRLPLARVRGKVGDDDIERVSTQTLFDILEVPQRRRNAGACRRLATLMRELGWSPIKARGLTPGGFRDQVRGWARDKRKSPLA
jgi:hypothetical protein